MKWCGLRLHYMPWWRQQQNSVHRTHRALHSKFHLSARPVEPCHSQAPGNDTWRVWNLWRQSSMWPQTRAPLHSIALLPAKCYILTICNYATPAWYLWFRRKPLHFPGIQRQMFKQATRTRNLVEQLRAWNPFSLWASIEVSATAKRNLNMKGEQSWSN